MTSQIQVNLNPQSVSQKAHPEVAEQLQGTVSEGGVGGSPTAGMILPLISIGINPVLTKLGQAAFLGQCPCPQQWPTP